MADNTISIEFDVTKLPAGMSAQDVCEIVSRALSTVVGDYERPGIPYDDEKAVMDAIVEPAPTCGADDFYDDSMDGDHASALASAGWGTDEDYGCFDSGLDDW